MEAGIYTFGYIIRPTHARTFEFYHPEVFGRVSGKIVKIVDGK
jgi:hypothetical protein